jgi:very-short-patch-repair endonuclease
MVESGLAPISKHDVSGYELDFGLIRDGVKLNIEVDGDQHFEFGTTREHSPESRLRLRRQDVERDRILSRAGWVVLRVPAWLCIQRPQEVIDKIETLLNEVAIASTP